MISFLAASFNYPAVLDGRAADVLPALLATGDAGRAVWAIYSLLPLIWIPAAVGAFYALRGSSEGAMRMAVLFAVVASLSMIGGLMRWPSFHWELAQAWAGAEPSARPALEALFDATNRYLGNYIGEFLGELSLLTGQRASVGARAAGPATVIVIQRVDFRRTDQCRRRGRGGGGTAASRPAAADGGGRRTAVSPGGAGSGFRRCRRRRPTSNRWDPTPVRR